MAEILPQNLPEVTAANVSATIVRQGNSIGQLNATQRRSLLDIDLTAVPTAVFSNADDFLIRQGTQIRRLSRANLIAGVYPPNAAESVNGLVEFATQSEVWEAADVDAVVRAKHMLVRRTADGGLDVWGNNSPPVDNGIQIGYGAMAHSRGAIAIGSEDYSYEGAQVNSEGSIAIGSKSEVLGYDTNGIERIAVGTYAQVHSGVGAMALGSQAQSAGEYSIAIGRLSRASHFMEEPGAIAIGFSTFAEYAGSLAIGFMTEATAQDAVSIGGYSKASGDGSIAIGLQASTEAGYSIAIGDAANTAHTGGIAIGYQANTEDNSIHAELDSPCMAIGYNLYMGDYRASTFGPVMDLGSNQRRMRIDNNSLQFPFSSYDIPPLSGGNGEYIDDGADPGSLIVGNLQFRVDTSSGPDPVVYVDFNIGGTIKSLNLGTLT